MIGSLGGVFDAILCELRQVGAMVLDALVAVANVFIVGIAGLGALLVAALPAMPEFPSFPGSLAWIGWGLPVEGLAGIGATVLAIYVVFIPLRIGLRWLRAL